MRGLRAPQIVPHSAPVSGAGTTEEDSNAVGNDSGRGSRPLQGNLLNEGRRQAARARSEGRDRLPRSPRGGSRLGDLRLGCRWLAAVRLGSRGPADPEGSRAQGEARRRTILRAVRRVAAVNTPTPIKVGVIMDLTGPLSFMGIASANVARMVIGDINDNGGLLGRPIELFVEDSATEDAAAEASATKLVQDDHVDVVFGG